MMKYIMQILKKLIFVPFFFLSFGLLTYLLNPLFSSYDVLFSLSFATLTQFLILASLIILSSFFFILFCTLAQDWKLILPVAAVASLIPLILIPPSLNLVLLAGILITCLLAYLSLEKKLKTYLNFEPNSLFGPSIRYMATLLVLVTVLCYFLSINKVVLEKGFQIPDSLIDTALKFTPQQQSVDDTQPSLSKDQIDLLRKNPELLRQSGLDPKMLDNLQPSTKTSKSMAVSQDLIKQSVKDQLNALLKPYRSVIPAILSILFFVTLQSLVTFLGMLIYPLLWIIFSILEKTNFIKFEVEQRSVKKMVI